MLESFYIANQFSKYNQNKHLLDSDNPVKIYIISMNWFEKWKSYVNYEYFISENKIDLYLNFSNQIFSIEENKQISDIKNGTQRNMQITNIKENKAFTEKIEKNFQEDFNDYTNSNSNVDALKIICNSPKKDLFDKNTGKILLKIKI